MSKLTTDQAKFLLYPLADMLGLDLTLKPSTLDIVGKGSQMYDHGGGLGFTLPLEVVRSFINGKAGISGAFLHLGGDLVVLGMYAGSKCTRVFMLNVRGKDFKDLLVTDKIHNGMTEEEVMTLPFLEKYVAGFEWINREWQKIELTE